MKRRLGFGRDGAVYTTGLGTAVKSFGDTGAFRRELICYQRLHEHQVVEISGHNVPALIGWDDARYVIEMSIVTRPFLLDFAGAYVDEAPDFSPEVLEQWYLDKSEQFGSRWPDVQAVLSVLETRYDIHLLDIHPGNIAFAEDEASAPSPSPPPSPA